MKAYKIELLPSALLYIEDIKSKLMQSRSIIFFDYDGTLSPIVSRPEDANLSELMRDTLGKLSKKLQIAVLSGRELSDIKEKIRLPHIFYGGSHGFEIEDPTGTIYEAESASDFLPFLENAFTELNTLFSNYQGIFIERKKYAIAIHYRSLKDSSQIQLIRNSLDNLIIKYPKLQLTSGKKIFELKPSMEWDKGKAVIFIMNQLFGNNADVYPVYLGDDITDEDAFKAIKDRGIGILVGRHEQLTYADYHLIDTEQVLRFINCINNAIL